MLAAFLHSHVGNKSAESADDESVHGEVFVQVDQAPVKVGEQVLARVVRGTRLRVLQVHGDWYRVRLRIDGRSIESWLSAAHSGRIEPPENATSRRDSTESSLLAKANELRREAEQYWENEEFADAIPLEKEALEIRRKLLGPEHHDTAESMCAVGKALANAGQSKEARRLQMQALEIRRKVLGEIKSLPGKFCQNKSTPGTFCRKTGRIDERRPGEFWDQKWPGDFCGVIRQYWSLVDRETPTRAETPCSTR